MNASELQKPGEKPDSPDEYQERGLRGGAGHKPREVTIEPRDPKHPLTQEPDRTWKWIGPPKSGRTRKG